MPSIFSSELQITVNHFDEGQKRPYVISINDYGTSGLGLMMHMSRQQFEDLIDCMNSVLFNRPIIDQTHATPPIPPQSQAPAA